MTGAAPLPQAVAKAITAAIESRRPKRRYQVGREVLAVRRVGLLPAEVTDRVVRLVSNLDG